MTHAPHVDPRAPHAPIFLHREPLTRGSRVARLAEQALLPYALASGLCRRLEQGCRRLKHRLHGIASAPTRSPSPLRHPTLPAARTHRAALHGGSPGVEGHEAPPHTPAQARAVVSSLGVGPRLLFRSVAGAHRVAESR